MLVALKSGLVRVVDNGTLAPNPFIDIRSRVHDNNDRGLLSIAVHPDFPSEPYVYLLYTHDPVGVTTPDGSGATGRVSQLMRVEADPATGYATAKPGTEKILLGTASTLANIGNELNGRDTSRASCMTGGTMAGNPVQDCLPSDETTHSVGTVVFGPDKTLYVSNGDASNFGSVDPRAMRAQNLDSLAGKILRIDPITGSGVPSNPFFQAGSPSSNRSKVYSYGLRQPFRITVHPQTGDVWVGDVGWNTWEEINTGKGANFGWPCYEGGLTSGDEGANTTSRKQGSYQSNGTTGAACSQLSAAAVTAPRYAYNHTPGGVTTGASANAGAFYTGSTYPAQYWNAQFIADYNRRWIKVLRTDPQGNVTATTFGTEASGGPVQIVSGPDTNLYWMRYSGSGGEVRRIRYVGSGNTPPVAVGTANPTVGQAPLVVSFSSAGTFDVDAQVLTYRWDFGDGASSSQPNPVHTYTARGIFDATLTVTDSAGAAGTSSVRIAVGNDPPMATIEAPADEATYKIGDVFTFAGRGSAGGNPLPATALTWELRQGHNEHFHYAQPTSNPDPGDPNRSIGSFIVDEHGDDTYYSLCLTATASQEAVDTRCVDLRPRKTTYTVATQPIGMQVSYEDEGMTLVGPSLITPIVGSQQTLSVEPIQSGRTFVRWDDNSTATTRTFTTGTTGRTLTAIFENRLPTVALNPSTPVSGNAPLTVGFTATGSDPEGTALAYTWEDGRGGTASGPSASFAYDTPGTYLVRVTGQDGAGGVSTASATVTVTGTAPPSGVIPAPWTSSVIGNVNPLGSATYSSADGGTFTVTGGGTDIWGTSDKFRYVHQPVTGDVDLVTRVTGQTAVHPWTKSGLMIRASIDPNAPHASVFVTPGNGVVLQHRPSASATSVSSASSAASTPRWLKLSRRGTTYTAFHSADGTTWTQVGAPVTLPTSALPSSAVGGLASTAHTSTTTPTAATATFTNTAITAVP
jgi:glucose/arabinose dehydrogenase